MLWNVCVCVLNCGRANSKCVFWLLRERETQSCNTNLPTFNKPDNDLLKSGRFPFSGNIQYTVGVFAVSGQTQL